MPTMRMPWSKPGNLQLDLLDAATLTEAAPSPPAAPGAAARAASMVPTASLHEDPHNPRTEIPEADLDELAEDIRQHGILQPIVVHPADAEGRHQIHFGAKRWRAAQLIGLLEVPVVVRDRPTNPYAQVAENQKRHGLTPLDLARFIRGRIDAGDSNTTVAKALGLDLTTVAHHLALLDLPPVVDAAMRAGRCASPRMLYELGKLHAEQPQRVAELVAGTDPITREAVAEIRDAGVRAPADPSAHRPRTARPSRAAQWLSRANSPWACRVADQRTGPRMHRILFSQPIEASMGFSASDVVPFTQARANLSELADQAKAGAEKIITKNGESYVALIDAERLDYYHQLERERIHLLLIADAQRGLADIEAGRTQGADAALAKLQNRRAAPARNIPQKPARKAGKPRG